MQLVHFDPAWRGETRITPRQSEQEPGFTPSGQLGTWPRMIKLDEDTETDLWNYIDNELEQFFLERGPLLEDWQNWQTLYWAKPATKQKNFPFTKAANIVIPLAAIAVEAIHARLMNTLFSVEPFWSIRPRSGDWIPAAKPFESYLQAEIETSNSLRMYDFCNESLLELIKLGTCVGKVGYEKLTKKSLRKVGGTEEPVYVDVKNGASVGRVPLGNFIMRFAELDPQTAPIVGEKHEYTWGQLKRAVQSGRMREDAVQGIKTYLIHKNQPQNADDGNALQAKVDELAKTEPQWTDVFEFFELWISFDVDGDGWDEEIVVDYHRESRTFLSIRYNWYDDLHRPYRVCNYINVEGIWPGIGVCKQTEQFQEEATTIHRQRLDNATLANMSQLIIKKDIGYGPGEPIMPGKMWFADDPKNDFREFKLSEVYPSSYNNEESVVRYWEKHTGANEVILGQPHEGTPGTATSDLTRLAESNKRFDLVLKNVRSFLSDIGVDVITNMQIFGNQQAHWMILGEDGIWVEQVLRMPSTLVRRGAAIDLSVTDSITNRETEQRQWMQLFQIITGHYDRVGQYAQLMAQFAGDPTLLFNVLQKLLQTSDEALKRLLETFQIPDSDRFALVEDNPLKRVELSNGNGLPPGPVEPGSTGTPGPNNQTRVPASGQANGGPPNRPSFAG